MVKQSRQTKQKELIQEELLRFNHFFDVDELFNAVSKRDASIGIATIYRFLKEAKEKNELYSYICNRKTIYSKANTSHCHFICEESGKIIHFSIDNLDFLKDKIPGTINSFQLEVKGVCKTCSTKSHE